MRPVWWSKSKCCAWARVDVNTCGCVVCGCVVCGHISGGCIVVDQQCRESNGKVKIEGYTRVSDEQAHHHLIIFGDLNHQRSQEQIHLYRSRSIHWEHIKEVWTSRCKQHQNLSPSGCTLREIQRNHTPKPRHYSNKWSGHWSMLPSALDPTLHVQPHDYHDTITTHWTHMSNMQNIPRYPRGTKGLHIKYNRSLSAGLIRYSDSDWGENKDDCHSTSGHVFLMANGCISWASQQQKTVALSVGEAEYIELASTGWQAAWLKSINREVGFHIHKPIPLCTDNQAAIFLIVNPAVKHWTKHIDIQHHYIWEQYDNKVIEPSHIPGEENPADLFTKSLTIVKVEKFRTFIGLS